MFAAQMFVNSNCRLCARASQRILIQSRFASSKGRWQSIKLLKLAGPVKYRIAAGCGLLAISSAVSISVPYFMGKIIDGIFNPGDRPSVSSVFSMKKRIQILLIKGINNKLYTNIRSKSVIEIGDEEWHPPLVFVAATPKATGVGVLGDRRLGGESYFISPVKVKQSNGDENLSKETNNDEKKPSLPPKEELKQFCLALTAIFTIGATANFGRVYLMQTAGQQVINRLRTKVFGSILKQEIAFFDRSKTGELVNRLSNDASLVGNSVTSNISDGLRSLASASGGTAMMVYCSPKLSILGLGIVPPFAIIAIVYGRYLRDLTKKMNDALADATQIAEERISNMRTVRAFGAEKKETKEYTNRIDSVLDLAWRDALARGVFFAFTGLSGNLIMLSILYSGGNLVAAGQMSIGELSSFLLYALYVGISIGGLSGFYTELMRGMGASIRLFDIINRAPQIKLAGFTPQFLNGELKFENISFAYPMREEALILDNFNLTVPSGKVTAIVGPSGSGKSTLASLVLRFYDVQKGGILLDNRNIQEIDPTWLRKHVAFVSQDPILFSCSIRENLLYGLEEGVHVSMEKLRIVAKQANALQFIENFPKGWDTILGERGMTLSGGQRQRVAIGRALMLDPKLLILDEATSALDSESESQVQKALEQLLKTSNRTVLIIAHRLSTIKNANQIAVLDNKGSVVELGGYSELMQIQDGIFRKLVHKQTLDYHLD